MSAEKLLALIERFARLATTLAEEQGLKPVHVETLRYLAAANRFSRSPSALAAFLGQTKGTVSQSLMALERRGLIARHVEAADRRRARLELTSAGKRALAKADAAIAALYGGMTAAEQAAMAKALGAALGDVLEKRGRRTFGMCRECRHFRASAPGGAPHYCSLLELPLKSEDAGRICAEMEAA